MKLSDLPVGKTATIDFSDSKSPLIPRLIDMGMSTNTPVTCLFKSLSGGMRAYSIGSGTIAIRREDARSINIL